MGQNEETKTKHYSHYCEPHSSGFSAGQGCKLAFNLSLVENSELIRGPATKAVSHLIQAFSPCEDMGPDHAALPPGQKADVSPTNGASSSSLYVDFVPDEPIAFGRK